MNHQYYYSLPKEAKDIRETVFVKEQGFQEEFSDWDNHCIHVVIYQKDKPAACGRMYQGEEKQEWVFGRIAVLSEFRGQQLGQHIVELLEEKAREMGAVKTVLSAQLRVKEFYEKCGYHGVGEVYLDEYCEHIRMERVLSI